MQIWNRRHFLKTAAAVSAAAVGASRASGEVDRNVIALSTEQEPGKPVAANDHIQIALIGAGGQGMYDTTAMGTHLPPHDPTKEPRFVLMMIAALAFGGIVSTL